ncbi:MAG: RNA polymerase sigma factor [Candidatus Omnitrophota bacterium]|nr:RNA polymerase sigma factor [Candidatus Omnitrophota bacterium]
MNMQNMRDEELMLEYQKGTMNAMEEFLRRYKNPIYRFAFRLCANEAEAQDIAQETFLRLHEHRGQYRPVGKFSTWLFSIAHNIAISRFRKVNRFVLWPRKPDDPDESVEFESNAPSPSQTLERSDFENAIKKCIQDLPFLQKEALLLCGYESLDYKEIAKILNKSLGN